MHLLSGALVIGLQSQSIPREKLQRLVPLGATIEVIHNGVDFEAISRVPNRVDDVEAGISR